MSIIHEWPMVKLGDISQVVSGGTPKTSEPSFWDGDVPWITPADLGKNSGLAISGGEKFISQDGLKKSSAVLIPAGSVVLSSRAPIGHIAINTRPLATNQGCKSFVPTRDLDARYLAHYLIYIRGHLQQMGTGATFKELSRSRAQEIPVPLPPLPEQQRIADMLNASAEIIHKEEHLQRSILPLVINIVEKKVASPDSTLGNLIESMSSGKNVAESPDPNQQNRVLKVSAVTSGTFKPAESKPLPDTYLPPKTHQVRKGDILVSRANTTELLGASALVENDVESLYLPDKIWRVTPKDGVDPYLLWSILQAKTVRARISQRATGSSGSMKNISQKNFLQVPCTTFSRSESVKLAALIREAVSVHHQITQNLTRLRSLHHSLSTRAFAGQL